MGEIAPAFISTTVYTATSHKQTTIPNEGERLFAHPHHTSFARLKLFDHPGS